MNCAVRISRRTAFAGALILCGFRPTSDALAQSEVNLVMHTETFRDAASGQWIRRFSGRAAPREAFIDPDTGAVVRPRDLFPNQNDPFAINDRLQLGEGGYALRTLDRARLGMAPGRDHQSWAMNMIPFGVLLDGSILDPSGPWYDGGPADPNNPFDRACTGWEYEVTHPVVSQLVGVPALIAGHVQPSGMFHYHGYPRLLIEALRSEALARGKSSGPLTVGYSADGFPVLDYRFAESPGGRLVFRFSGYVLRKGQRQVVEFTNPATVPLGNHDGLYVQDYVFDPRQKNQEIEAALAQSEAYFGLTRSALRDGRASYALLDQHNGGVLGDVEGYQGSVYGYVLTPDWPMVPRLFAFEPDETFKQVIPFEPTGFGSRILKVLGVSEGRRSLYDNCPADLRSIRQWHERPPY